ncbi:MAG: rhodanese-like domain-containing protein [Pirellulales bacterium]
MRMHSKTVAIVAALVIATAATAGCRPVSGGSDADKRRQIEERYVVLKQAFPAVRDMTVAELIELGERQALVIVDVRPKEERDVSMIPNAVSEDWFEEHRDQYRDKLVVTYCTIGARSGKYAEALQQEGFDVLNLSGSILAWAHEGRPLIAKGGPTNRVHVYSADWNLLPAGYEAVW